VTTTAPLLEGPAFDAVRVKVSFVCTSGVKVDADFVRVTAANSAETEKVEDPEVTGVCDPGGVPDAVAESVMAPLFKSA
jgi:hypothetical protein